MKIAPITALLLLLTTTGLLAQGTQQPQQGAPRRSTGTVTFGGVPTQPSNNPFKDPIGQGVPPAASSTRPYINSGRTGVPLNSGR